MANINFSLINGINEFVVIDGHFPDKVFHYPYGGWFVEIIRKRTNQGHKVGYNAAIGSTALMPECKESDMLILKHQSGKFRDHTFCYPNTIAPIEANSDDLASAIMNIANAAIAGVAFTQIAITPTAGQTVFPISPAVTDAGSLLFFRNGVLQPQGTGITTVINGDVVVTYLLNATNPMLVTDSVLIFYK